ncbi:MAG: hypothetical protein ACTHM1_04045 [Solirubrobacteraceae bacterium]
MSVYLQGAVWPGREAKPRSYREEVGCLVEYDGQTCLWRFAAGLASVVSIPVLSVGAFVAGLYIADLHDTARVVLAAIVTLGGTWLAERIRQRRPWRSLVTTRLASYEDASAPGDLNAVIRIADFDRASRVLRRAKLYPFGGTHLPEGLPGAPDLDLKLIVHRSARWHAPNAPEIYLQVIDCFRAAGIRACVAGEDVAADSGSA